MALAVLSQDTCLFYISFDAVYCIKNDLMINVKYSIPLLILTDFKILFKIIVILTMKTEKQLTIDIKKTRKAYKWNEVKNFGWITAKGNISIALTNLGKSKSLEELLDFKRKTLTVTQFILRDKHFLNSITV